MTPARFATDDQSPRPSADATTPTGIEAEPYAPFTLSLTAGGAVHPAFALHGRASRNRPLWSRMPSFYWAADLGEPAPGATVLAERVAAETRAPLIVEHLAGAGRVLMVGLDTTYRWRRNVGDHVFRHFWVHALRHVAGPRRRAEASGWLELTPPHAAPGEPIGIEAYVVDENGAGLETEHITLQVRADQQQEAIDPITLPRTAGSGHYRGQWTPPGQGTYELAIENPVGESATARLRVRGDTLEYTQVTLDRDRLAALAMRGGGGLLELTELDRFGDLLEGEPVFARTVHEQEIWDNWLVLVILVSLYCMDVYVRRLAGMT